MKIRVRLAAMVALAACLASPALSARAETYPSRTVRFIVPVGPGSGADTMTRAFAERFQRLTGQAAIVENKPGADLIIGAQNLLNSPADGYSILMISPTSMVINPAFIKELPYKVEDIRPVMNLTKHMAVIVTRTGSPFATLTALLNAAKQKPESVNVGSYGNHYRLSALALGQRANAPLSIISYKGSAAAVADLLAGSVDAAFVDLGGVLPLINSGKLRALGVSGRTRSPMLPNTPTIAEAGFPGFELYTFVGYGIHAKTPEPVAKALEALMLKVVAEPGLQEFIKQQPGAEFSGLPAREFSVMIKSDAEKTRGLVKTFGAALRD